MGNDPFRSFPTLPDGGKFQHRRAISAINSRTSSSRVAQLMQKRTVLWVSSSRRKKAKPYFHPSSSRTESGIVTNCWFVPLEKGSDSPLERQKSRSITARRSAWAPSRK